MGKVLPLLGKANQHDCTKGFTQIGAPLWLGPKDTSSSCSWFRVTKQSHFWNVKVQWKQFEAALTCSCFVVEPEPAVFATRGLSPSEDGRIGGPIFPWALGRGWPWTLSECAAVCLRIGGTARTLQRRNKVLVLYNMKFLDWSMVFLFFVIPVMWFRDFRLFCVSFIFCCLVPCPSAAVWCLTPSSLCVGQPTPFNLNVSKRHSQKETWMHMPWIALLLW